MIDIRDRWRHAAAGAAAGGIAWACVILLGIPLLAGFHGHDFTILAMLLGAALALTRMRTALFATAVALAAVVAVIAYTPLIERPARSLVRRDPPPVTAPGAVVVLGADVSPDSLLFAQSLDRMLAGAALMQRSGARVLVVPGNVLEERGRRVAATRDQQRIIHLAGLSDRVVLVSDSVYSTRDEAVRAAALLHPRGIRRVYVVTSPLHSWRACRTFARVGFIVTCSPSESRDVALGAMYRSTDRLAAFRLWLYEQAAAGVYHLKGWI